MSPDSKILKAVGQGQPTETILSTENINLDSGMQKMIKTREKISTRLLNSPSRSCLDELLKLKDGNLQ